MKDLNAIFLITFIVFCAIELEKCKTIPNKKKILFYKIFICIAWIIQIYFICRANIIIT